MQWRRGRGLGAALGAVAAAGLLAGALSARAAPVRNGFELEPASIPTDEILRGGPPRDGIPALEDPKVERADAAGWKAEDVVLGVEIGGEARAYPAETSVFTSSSGAGGTGASDEGA